MIECGEFMDALEALGARFRLDSDRLAVSAPPGALTAEHRAELTQRRDTIERLVRSAVTPWVPELLPLPGDVAVQLTMGEAA